jgi:branched-chain amino acid transport system ATP-binding protein
MLEVSGVSVHYGAVRAVEGIAMELAEGELVAMVGANGAGKSSLIAAILGIPSRITGSIRFDGVQLIGKATDAIVGMGIAVVPEGRGVMPRMTVLENLQLGAYHVRRGGSARISDVCEQFPILGERRRQLAGTLSGGQQQILAIGRALVAGPRLLILDEPTLGLSPVAVRDLFATITELHGGGQTILLSEQNAYQALHVADRAYVFDVGRVALHGTADDLMQDERVQHAYLGENLDGE